MVNLKRMDVTESQDIPSIEPIGLNDLQRSKLEELCLAYFPEYNGMITVDRVAVMFNGKNPIHWFELCGRILLPKIYTRADELIRASMAILLSSTIHPVDYLYNKYLEEQQAEFEENRQKSL